MEGEMQQMQEDMQALVVADLNAQQVQYMLGMRAIDLRASC